MLTFIALNFIENFKDFTLFIGFWVAFIHVLSGPDHLAAVMPIVLDSKKKHWYVGFVWGLGHLLGMLLIGVLFIFFKDQIPVNPISIYSDKLVGVILVLLGLWSLFKINSEREKHIHPHIHQEKEKYVYVHQHQQDIQHQHDKHTHYHQNVKKQNKLGSFFIGIIHGFAGVAHFILLLPVLSFSSVEGVQYIFGFSAGTIASMTLFAIGIGKLRHFNKRESLKTSFLWIRVFSGIGAVLIGVLWILL